MQRACQRALIVLGGTITTSDAIAWAYARRLLLLGEGRNWARSRLAEVAEARDRQCGDCQIGFDD